MNDFEKLVTKSWVEFWSCLSPELVKERLRLFMNVAKNATYDKELTDVEKAEYWTPTAMYELTISWAKKTDMLQVLEESGLIKDQRILTTYAADILIKAEGKKENITKALVINFFEKKIADL